MSPETLLAAEPSGVRNSVPTLRPGISSPCNAGAGDRALEPISHLLQNRGSLLQKQSINVLQRRKIHFRGRRQCAPRALAHEPAMMAPCFGAAPARRAALERRDDTPTEGDDDVDRDETAANVKPARSHPALDIGPYPVS